MEPRGDRKFDWVAGLALASCAAVIGPIIAVVALAVITVIAVFVF